ncbi:MAG: PEP-CTERM sorting domain-containing protein [Kiritimatiellaceae bacterium]|nr:PEP-CTERM sorting domain-containing protein [Kiritimatiellaceae bacterium]
MRSISKRLIAMLALIALSGVAQAASGTWTNLTSGLNYGTPGNWLGGVVAAGGAGMTADFNTLNITGDTTVNLEAARGIEDLVFGDTDTSTAGSWIISNTNTLTFSGTTPSITVNALGAGKSATINAKVGGTAGLTKDGVGTLILATNAVYTGNTVISNGTLQLSLQLATGTGLSSTNITVKNGGTFALAGGVFNGTALAAGTFLDVENGGTLRLDKYLVGKYAKFATGASVTGTNLLYLNVVDAATRKVLTMGSADFSNLAVVLRPDNTVNPTQTLQFDGTGNGATMKALTLQPGVNVASTGIHNYIMDIGDSATADNDLTVATLTTSGDGTQTRIMTKQGLGTMLVSNNVTGNNANYDLNVNTGKMIFAAAANMKSITVGSSGTLQLGNDAAGGSSTTAIANNGTVDFKRTDAYTHSANISGSGLVNKSGTGDLTFTGAKTYTNTTTVSAGKLIVDGSLLSRQIDVLNGATLSGSGTVQSVTLNAGAILAVGNSPGTMTFASDVVLSAGSTNIMEIFTVGFDVLKGSATNTLTMAGATIFDFTGNTVTTGTTFNVVQNWGTVTTNGATFSVVGLGEGQDLDYSQLVTSGIVTVIPEPATIGMLGLGALITLMLRRMRTR